MNEPHAKVVEMRCFAGLRVVETAHVLEVSERTVRNGWRAARAWRRSELRDVRP
jgi:RNA polymerase sigma-70 factor (ECF subfamily)